MANEAMSGPLEGEVVEEEVLFSLVELSHICQVPEDQVLAWVSEGALEPAGDAPPQWRFAGVSLRRTRVAVRLARDFELSSSGVALALDLLDEIDALRAELRRGAGGGRR